MSKMIFVNLPVRDLAASTAFYEAVGGTKNPQFSDAAASCIVFSDTIYAMLLTHDKYRHFTQRPIADTHKTSAVLIATTVESKDEVDRIVARHPREARQTPTQNRITVSCMAAASKTRMGTSGSWFGWTCPPSPPGSEESSGNNRIC